MGSCPPSLPTSHSPSRLACRPWRRPLTGLRRGVRGRLAPGPAAGVAAGARRSPPNGPPRPKPSGGGMGPAACVPRRRRQTHRARGPAVPQGGPLRPPARRRERVAPVDRERSARFRLFNPSCYGRSGSRFPPSMPSTGHARKNFPGCDHPSEFPFRSHSARPPNLRLTAPPDAS